MKRKTAYRLWSLIASIAFILTAFSVTSIAEEPATDSSSTWSVYSNATSLQAVPGGVRITSSEAGGGGMIRMNRPVLLDGFGFHLDAACSDAELTEWFALTLGNMPGTIYDASNDPDFRGITFLMRKRSADGHILTGEIFVTTGTTTTQIGGGKGALLSYNQPNQSTNVTISIHKDSEDGKHYLYIDEEQMKLQANPGNGFSTSFADSIENLFAITNMNDFFPGGKAYFTIKPNALFAASYTYAVTNVTGITTPGRTYYISDTLGNDNNTGLSEEKPWKTLNKVNTQTFHPGDRILLRRGDTWSGQSLIPQGDGTDEDMIEIGAYGTGNKPLITNPNAVMDADLATNTEPDPRTFLRVGIKIKQWQGWKVKDIRITQAEYGLIVINLNRGRYAGAWVENCEFEDITGGRYRSSSDPSIPSLPGSVALHISGLDGVTIKNCSIRNTVIGMMTNSITGIHIDGIDIYNASAEGAEMVSTNNGSITNSSISHVGFPNGIYHGVAAMMFAGCKDVIMSDCELYDVYDPLYDGVAVDYEANNQNVTVTRCKMHDCYGSAVMVYDNGQGLDNEVVNITNNVIYNCGKRTDQYVRPAFLSHTGNLNCQGRVSGNRIQLDRADQKPYMLDGTVFTDICPGAYALRDNMVYTMDQAFPMDCTPPEDGDVWEAIVDFSGVQGSDNWYYQENIAGMMAPMTYIPADNVWLGEMGGGITSQCHITAGSNSETVLKWVAPESGLIQIGGTLQITSGQAEICLNGVTIWEGTTNPQLSDIPVTIGDSLYFMVKQGGTASFKPIITWNERTSWLASDSFGDGSLYNGYIHQSRTSAKDNFSATNGDNGWSYLALKNGDYSNMSYDADDGRWKSAGLFNPAYIGDYYQTPGSSYDAVRCWTAPVTGNIRITGQAMLEQSSTDGVQVTIKKNDTVLFTQTLTSIGAPGIYTPVDNVSVAAGDKIYFIVNRISSYTKDKTVWDPSIVYFDMISSENGTSGLQGAGEFTYWSWNETAYTAMSWDIVSHRWSHGATVCIAGSNWQHPDNGKDSVRQWTAPRDGVVSICGTASLTSGNGNGVVLQIGHNNNPIYTKNLLSITITGTDLSAKDMNITSLPVRQGDSILFIVNNNGSSDYDTVNWNPIITYLT